MRYNKGNATRALDTATLAENIIKAQDNIIANILSNENINIYIKMATTNQYYQQLLPLMSRFLGLI